MAIDPGRFVGGAAGAAIRETDSDTFGACELCAMEERIREVRMGEVRAGDCRAAAAPVDKIRVGEGEAD
jgi:hypothetical protein